VAIPPYRYHRREEHETMPLLPPWTAVGRKTIGMLLSAACMAAAGAEPCRAQATGASSGVSIPAWVPIYPGAKVGTITSSSPGVQVTIWFSVSTSDPCARVTKFYEDRLTSAGFSLVRGTTRNGCIGTLRAHDSMGREINLDGGEMPSGTRYGLEVTELSDTRQSSRPGPGPRQVGRVGGSEIPQWLPVYRQWAPRNVETRQSGRDSFVSFTFDSRDDARSILMWYQDQLRGAGFNVSMDTAGTNGALRSNTRDNRRSLKIEVSATGGKNVVLLEAREER
jgi:hypothetical protein